MIEKNKLTQTGETMVINIRGQQKKKKVYLIPIKDLKYNKLNDRIFTNMHNLIIEDNTNIEEKIEEFIWLENLNENKKTLKSIEKLDQYEAGIILSDGTLIDGNRRFTCLRKLHKKNNEKYKFFKGIILNEEDSQDKKILKQLELHFQHAIESKVDYDPINKALSIYRDIVTEKLFTIEEYSEYSNFSNKEIKKWIEKGKLMEELLEYMNRPKAYEIIKKWKVDGPIGDVLIMLNKVQDCKKQKIKNIVFDYMIYNSGKIDWKEIRLLLKQIEANSEKIVKIYEEKNVSDKIKEQVKKNKEQTEIKENKETQIYLEAIFNSMMRTNDVEIYERTVINDIKKVNSILCNIEILELKELGMERLEEYKTFKKLILDINNQITKEKK